MTTLFGDFHTVVGDASTATITIRSLITRSGTEAPGMITTEGDPLALVDGAMPEVEVDPGPTVVTLEGGGVSDQWVVDTPLEGRHDIASLVDMQFDYDPAVVSQAVAAKDEAVRQAGISRGHARDAASSAEHVDEVVSDGAAAVRAEFTDLTERSETARKATEDARGDAEKHRDDAEGFAREAEKSAGESAGSASEASKSATTAGDHATQTGKDATATDADRKAVAEDRKATEDARGDAEKHRDDAERHRDDAEGHSKAAGEAAGQAQGAARSAASDVRGEVADLTERSETAAGKAEQSEADAAEHRRRAEDAAKSASEVVSDGVADATSQIKGKLRLDGDLAGTADSPTVPGLALTAPGASVKLSPEGEGWSNAVGPPASTSTGWSFDGEWLNLPATVESVHVTVEWCGRTAAMLRGRRPDGTAMTIETVPAGDPEKPRRKNVLVNVAEHTALAVAGTWTAEDLDAGCAATLLVQPAPDHRHVISDIDGLADKLDQKIDEDDERLTDRRYPTDHRHELDQVKGLRDVVDRLMLIATRGGMWFTGDGPPPDDLPGARVGDYWYDETDEELHKITEVIDDDDSD